MTYGVNVAGAERWVSALGGAALAAYGLRRLSEQSPAGAVLTAAGGALIYRGATGHCSVYAAAGLTTADADDTRRRLAGSGGINVEEAVTINQPPELLYEFWRDFERLPAFMRNVVAVKAFDSQRSHWVVRGPGNRTVEWDAEIINEIPFELIAWRTLAGSDVVSAGSVHFERPERASETRVRVRLQYDPPAGKAGAAILWMFGREGSQIIREDLRRFKQLMETGEVPTTEGQPSGRRSHFFAKEASR
jgi:uncharacterized membrane protein